MYTKFTCHGWATSTFQKLASLPSGFREWENWVSLTIIIQELGFVGTSNEYKPTVPAKQQLEMNCVQKTCFGITD